MYTVHLLDCKIEKNFMRTIYQRHSKVKNPAQKTGEFETIGLQIVSLFRTILQPEILLFQINYNSNYFYMHRFN